MGGKIALAGASTGLGASFVDALVEKNVTDFVILSRKASEDVRKIAVDYNDVESLQRVLEEHQIETVVSTIAIDTDDSGQAQVNLIAAAEQASCTKRFIPSEFGAIYQEEQVSHHRSTPLGLLREQIPYMTPVQPKHEKRLTAGVQPA